MSFLIMVSTSGSEREARKIAQTLIQEKLAACVNVIAGVTSFFLWEGKLNKEKEALILIKTVSSRSKIIMSKIKEMNKYSTPEIVMLKIEGGEENYLKWVMKMISGRDRWAHRAEKSRQSP